MSLTAGAYAVSTDRPESDGTLAWDRTTLVVAEADSGSAANWFARDLRIRRGMGFHLQYSHDHARIEQMLLDVFAAAWHVLRGCCGGGPHERISTEAP